VIVVNKGLGILLLTVFLTGVAAEGQQRQFTSVQWLNDLEGVVQCMRNRHPDLYYRISEDDFTKIVDTARDDIQAADSDDACAVAIMKVIASIQDGHTQWMPDENIRWIHGSPSVCMDFPMGFLSPLSQRKRAGL